jgi:hypothetical protein
MSITITITITATQKWIAEKTCAVCLTRLKEASGVPAQFMFWVFAAGGVLGVQPT